MSTAIASLSFPGNRRVWAAVGFSVAVHALILSGWHLRIFTPPGLASMEPIEITLVAESKPRVATRRPPRTAKRTTQPAPVPEKAVVPEPRRAEPTESAPAQAAQ